MTTLHNSNTACCTIPPVLSKYDPKGSYKSFAGFSKVYITGPEGTGRALVGIFDIFGFWPQTLQGADILASTLDARVVLPDFFEPDAPYPVDEFPPETEEQKARFQAFFGGPAKIDVAVANVRRAVGALKLDGYARVATYGFCWGGKVSTLIGTESGVDAVASIHPAMMDVGDAEKLVVPIGLFPSKNESIDVYDKVVEVISTKPFASKNAYKYYSTMHHGWAAARANLDDPENKKQYEDVYSTLAGFYKGVWA